MPPIEFDLWRAAGLDGDPSDYFVDDGRDVTLVVEHATGAPVAAVVGGVAVPFDVWRRAAPPPPPGPPREITLRSADGALSLGVTVSTPRSP